MPYSYLKSPEQIYQKSFDIIEDEIDFKPYPVEIHGLLRRLVHACGMVDILPDLDWSSDCVAKSVAALSAQKAIFADCQMVVHGITQRFLPDQVRPVCTLADLETPDRAMEMGTTRSAAAVEAWRDQLSGAIVAIGNAPTALFHLLEMIEQGGPVPAVILGFPVGFVGAAESKQALHQAGQTYLAEKGCAYVTLQGRRGGSALAAAAVNAMALAYRQAPRNC